MADNMASPTTETSIQAPSASRSPRKLLYNANGQLYCNYPPCQGQTFTRTCEWNRHMDKHERPYKCKEAECDRQPGFTWAGGLLRHKIEVHIKESRLFCPFPNCKRAERGFTRKSNLEDHKQKMHSGEADDSASDATKPRLSVESTLPLPLKGGIANARAR